MATPAKQPPSLATPTTPTKPKAGRIRRACRRIYKVITSHIGLIFFLVAFSFIGAAIFHAIEGDNEKDEKADIQWLREKVINNVWNASAAVKRNEHAFRLLMRHEMKKYEAQLYAAFGDGINTLADVEVWDFWGSLFYCATVYTTIGYGNIFPATDVGRVVTIIYSLIGIPLCLIVLADLGKLFTRAIKWVWAFVRRFYYTRRWSRAGAKKVTEEKAEKAKQAAATKQSMKQSEASRAQQLPIEPPIPTFVVDDEFNLPVSVAIIITFVYILLGALVYCQWEQWSYLEAFYFVFISVSTIGFGDVLPDHPKYFLLSSLYVLVGLSLVAMVLNVIMEAMTVQLDNAQKNIADIARTVGIGIDEEDMEQSALSTQNGSAPRTPAMTPQGVSPAVTPAPSVSSLTPRDSYGNPITRDEAPYGSQDSRGRAPYRDRPGDYPGRDGTDLRRREPYDYRGGEPHQDYRGRPDDNRGRPDDYRGRPDDYRGRPDDYRGPSDYRSPDPRGDPRLGDRSPDRRMGDPRYEDPRADPRLADRGDPRYDPRSPTDPRTDPRFADPRMADPYNDPRMADPRGDPRMADPRMESRTPRTPSSYGPSQSPPEFYVS